MPGWVFAGFRGKLPVWRARTWGMADKQFFIYGMPPRDKQVVVHLDMDADLEERLSFMAHTNNWFEHHFYRYLLALGLERFLENPVQEADVGIDYSKDDLQEKI